MFIRTHRSVHPRWALAATLAGILLPLSVVAQSAEPPEVSAQLSSLGADTSLERDLYGGDRSSSSLSGAGTVVQRDGLLEFVPSDRGRPLTHRRALDAPQDVVRIEADVDIGPNSRAGLLCDSDEQDRAFSAGMLFGSGILIGRFDADGWTEGKRALHGQPFRPDARLAVECAVTAYLGEHIAVWLDGELVLEHTFPETIGPFGSMTLSAETVEPGEPMLFGRVDISGGSTYAPSTEGSTLATALTDQFDDETLWEAYDDGGLVVAYLDGALRTAVAEPGQSVWSWRTLETPMASMRVSSDVTLETDGVAGVMCGVDGDGVFNVGAVLGGGKAAIGRLTDGDIAVTEFLDVPPSTTVTLGTPLRLTLDCLERGGGQRTSLFVDGTLVASTWFTDGLGPLDAAGVFGEASSAASAARFDAFEVSLGD